MLKFTSKENGNSITLPQTDYSYAYTRKVNKYTETGYTYFFGADMTESEPFERVEYNYNMTTAAFNDLLDQLLDEYIEKITSESTGTTVIRINTLELLEPLIDQGIVWLDTVEVTYKYFTMFEPNNPLYNINAVGGFDGTLRDGEWRFMPRYECHTCR